MFNILIKLLVSKLHNLFLLASNVLCYECDSRYDRDCADPFDLSSLSLADQQTLVAAQAGNSSQLLAAADQAARSRHQTGPGNGTAPGQQQQQLMLRPPKKMPRVAVCHGCCVKITSKTEGGAVYVKRTCTTNLQINYFMVGLICMKESGDRGKMCFCETDYCNGQSAGCLPSLSLLQVCLLLAALLLVTTTKLTR